MVFKAIVPLSSGNSAPVPVSDIALSDLPEGSDEAARFWKDGLVHGDIMEEQQPWLVDAGSTFSKRTLPGYYPHSLKVLDSPRPATRGIAVQTSTSLFSAGHTLTDRSQRHKAKSFMYQRNVCNMRGCNTNTPSWDEIRLSIFALSAAFTTPAQTVQLGRCK